MKRKSYLILALVLAATISGGIYASTYTIDSATFSVTAATGDLAVIEEVENQPYWDIILTYEMETAILRPVFSGNYTESEPIGDVSNYLCVDDDIADEDDTYVRTEGDVTELDSYDLADFEDGYGPINSVTVYVRSKGTKKKNTHAAETLIRTYDTDYFGDTTLLPKSYTELSTIYMTNPFTGNAWTWDEIQALEAGVRHYDQGKGDVMTTQVYVEVSHGVIPLEGEVPAGGLSAVTPNADYAGDLVVKAYLTNSGSLTKAYDSLEIQLYLTDSIEAGQIPDYQVLSLNNGVATFHLTNSDGISLTLSVTGGSYRLNSSFFPEWEEGWTVIPELYFEVSQR